MITADGSSSSDETRVKGIGGNKKKEANRNKRSWKRKRRANLPIKEGIEGVLYIYTLPLLLLLPVHGISPISQLPLKGMSAGAPRATRATRDKEFLRNALNSALTTAACQLSVSFFHLLLPNLF